MTLKRSKVSYVHDQFCHEITTYFLFYLKVGESLKKINFTINLGEQVWFDSTGATAAKYDVVNWQRGLNGEVQFKAVGYYDASLPTEKQFVLNTEDIIWAGGIREVQTIHTMFLK